MQYKFINYFLTGLCFSSTFGMAPIVYRLIDAALIGKFFVDCFYCQRIGQTELIRLAKS